LKSLYEQIGAIDTNDKSIVATVVEGHYLGEKALFSKGEIVFQSDSMEFLHIHTKIILKATRTGTITIEGNRIFCEILGAEKKLVICGGGHISIPIIKIGRMADFSVTVIEDRFSFANNATLAGANQVICEPFEQGLKKINGDKHTFFIIVTRGHRFDQLCLETIIPKENAYIGMIGSKIRINKVKDQLIENGIDPQKLEKVYTPIGLKINAETPVEIAISIMSEIIQVKNKKVQSCGYSKALLKAIKGEEGHQEKKILATIISRKGSAPREVGTKMLIFLEKTIETLGGGCLEAEIKMKAFSMLIDNQPKAALHLVDMTGWQAEEDGMVCGGIIEVFLEMIEGASN